jgi:hypothetical protein
MKLTITYILTVAIGIGLFSGVAYLVLIFPAFRAPVFLLGSSWWLWTAWRHASSQRALIPVAAPDTDTNKRNHR